MENIQRLIWLDLEMTGLDIETCHIIEIAAIITDVELNIVAESNAIAIYQPDEIMANMNTWCQKTHQASGLIERIKEIGNGGMPVEILTDDQLLASLPEDQPAALVYRPNGSVQLVFLR